MVLGLKFGKFFLAIVLVCGVGLSPTARASKCILGIEALTEYLSGVQNLVDNPAAKSQNFTPWVLKLTGYAYALRNETLPQPLEFSDWSSTLANFPAQESLSLGSVVRQLMYQAAFQMVSRQRQELAEPPVSNEEKVIIWLFGAQILKYIETYGPHLQTPTSRDILPGGEIYQAALEGFNLNIDWGIKYAAENSKNRIGPLVLVYDDGTMFKARYDNTAYKLYADWEQAMRDARLVLTNPAHRDRALALLRHLIQEIRASDNDVARLSDRSQNDPTPDGQLTAAQQLEVYEDLFRTLEKILPLVVEVKPNTVKSLYRIKQSTGGQFIESLNKMVRDELPLPSNTDSIRTLLAEPGRVDRVIDGLISTSLDPVGPLNYVGSFDVNTTKAVVYLEYENKSKMNVLEVVGADEVAKKVISNHGSVVPNEVALALGRNDKLKVTRITKPSLDYFENLPEGDLRQTLTDKFSKWEFFVIHIEVGGP